jgi:hypothetical protein
MPALIIHRHPAKNAFRAADLAGAKKSLKATGLEYFKALTNSS